MSNSLADKPSIEANAAQRPRRQSPTRKKFFQWVPTDAQQLQLAEQILMHGLGYQQRNIAGINTVTNVTFASSDTSRAQPDPTKESLVLFHGFAGGLAMWAQNWEALTEQFNVYAIDLPGFARSERPRVHFVTSDDAMQFYYTYLDRWFHELQIKEPVTILGHSFGAYIAARYTLYTSQKGRKCIKRVVLADPWGVPKADPDFGKDLPFRFKLAMKVFQVTNPLSVLRAAGPLGPRILPKIRPDFASRWEGHLDEPEAFYDYTFHCNAQYPPTGETAFKACCDVAVYAKEPLEELLATEFPRDIELFALYGSHTWMDTARGCAMIADLREKGVKAAAARVYNAGHQLNTDNPLEFNAKALMACKGALEHEF